MNISPGRWGMKHRNHYSGYGKFNFDNFLLKEIFDSCAYDFLCYSTKTFFLISACEYCMYNKVREFSKFD